MCIRDRNPRVVVAEPELRSFKITEDLDFLLLASDGVFDRLTNKEIVDAVWAASTTAKGANMHDHVGFCVDVVMKEALAHRTLDNISVVIVAFKNFKRAVFPKASAPRKQSHAPDEPIREQSFDQAKLRESDATAERVRQIQAPRIGRSVPGRGKALNSSTRESEISGMISGSRLRHETPQKPPEKIRLGKMT
eukprot:TRINITY_DN2899_c0_g1_i3.p1 TRINITY_DN2899_c0_g1~~TRINITY_DN2899_c0_g1_i3.p1  ORF type:complete len:193 (-),score=29.29 TRINITY_DN2899_c0_g1_i3:544-1122(-)